MRSGSAAEMKSALRCRAPRIRSPELARDRIVFGELQVVLGARRLRAGGHPAVDPARRIEALPRVATWSAVRTSGIAISIVSLRSRSSR